MLGANPSKVKIGWVTPEESESLIPAAVAAAKQASTAIVFAYDDETEGTDRSSIALAEYQNDLITQVAKANPHTVVVLNTGSAVAMPWLNDVSSVLDMWYPGQDGAEATTALLFGDAAPGGRLTQTFPTGDNATPVSGKPTQFPGVDGQVDFSEGIDVGYRWYEANNVQPLFPFGFGLTYTSFAYHGLAAYPTGDGGIDVLAAVTNTGKRTGQAVPQIYLGPSPAVSEPQAVRALAGYTKLTLQPGETRIATIHVESSQLNYWNTTTNGWSRGTGQRTIWLGSSSADLAWHQPVTVD
ncbi:MAG TPA: glycoside hydrolase family 3 C-terminal domain-containing protein [Pseudonocardiaceae bacterium]